MGNTEDDEPYRRKAILKMVATMSSTEHDGQYCIDVEQYFQRWAILATTGNTEDNGQY